MFPREKFLRGGVSVLSDIELIQILVGSGIKGRSFRNISKAIMRKVRECIRGGKLLNIGDLNTIQGVGNVVAMRLIAGIELGRRIYGIEDSKVVKVKDSESAYNIFKDMSQLKRERVDIVCLNSRFDLICRESIALGSLNCANLSPREVLYTSIVNNAAFVILAHNHPSGESTPSLEDINLTKRINSALEIVDIQLLDHLVIGKDIWSSVSV